MKQFFAFVALTALVAVGLSAADSPFYAKVAQVSKVISSEKGYRVTYLTNKFEGKTIYVPMEWMYQSPEYRTDDGFIKCEVVRGNGPAYPYVQFFWKNGKFHHMRLFVNADYNDVSWGTSADPAALALQFDPKKELDLKF